MGSASQTRTAASLRALLLGLIDYAGLFPPAGVSMDAAVANYAKYHRAQGWSFLGSFIVPASRLKELEQIFDATGERCWYLSVTFGKDIENDLRETSEFIARNTQADRVRVGAVELKSDSVELIRDYNHRLNRCFGETKFGTYFEISPEGDTTSLLQAIRDCDARAKIRTGGLVADAFPDATAIARFIALCAEEGVAFKATAGLHHPFRCVKPLTYEANAPTGTMHGFLNVFVAAVITFYFKQRDGSPIDVELQNLLRAVLLNEDPARFSFNESTLTVRVLDHTLEIPTAEVELARERFCISFGSCSFEEPLEDLRSLNLL